MIELKDIEAKIGDKQILKEFNFKAEKGKVYAIMGPNGSGKSTFTNVISGHPLYDVEGSIKFLGEDIMDLEPDERAKKGIFVSFQYPLEIPGLSLFDFLYTSYTSIHSKVCKEEFRKTVEEVADNMNIDHSFLDRGLNEGCSGGEKKKNEILQMKILNPQFVVLDETDSGLDIDALKVVAEGVNSFMNKDKCVVLITHYQRLLDYINPDIIHVMKGGKIVKTGNSDLAIELEEKGYSLCS